jgi:hypothetical protein
MDSAKPSLNATSFSFQKRSLRLIIAALVLQIGAVGFILYVGIRRSTLSASLYTLYTLAAATFFLRMIVVTARQLSTVEDRVAVDDVGVWYFPAKSAHTVLRWDDIAGVKKSGIMIKSLEIVDRTGAVRIKLHDRLENLDTLERLINEHKDKPTDTPPS